MSKPTAEMELTQDDLKTLLRYNQKTGHFTWNVSTTARVKVGQRAGYLDKESGYRRIGITLPGRKKRNFFEHRLAIFYVTGAWPGVVDHKDTHKDNNIFLNLRDTGEGGANSRNVSKVNASGFKGVARTPVGRFAAKVCHNKKQIYLGTFDKAKDAARAYDKAVLEIEPECPDRVLNFPEKRNG